MKVDHLNAILEQVTPYRRLLAKGAAERLEVIGIEEEVRLLLAAHLALTASKAMLYVAENEDRAKKIFRMAKKFFPGENLGYYPPQELLPYGSFSENRDLALERIRTVQGLLEKKPFFAVVPAVVLSQKLLPKEVWQASTATFQVGDVRNFNDLIETFVSLGYRREPLTEEAGVFSVRGSILDFFPPGATHPFRLDFFDDEIVAIRSFDEENQISLAPVNMAKAPPAAQFIITAARREKGLDIFKEEAQRHIAKLRTTAKKKALDQYKRLCEEVEAGLTGESLAPLLPYFYADGETLLAYLDKEDFLVLDEGLEIHSALEAMDKENQSIYSELLLAGEVFPSYSVNFQSVSEIYRQLNRGSLLNFAFIQGPTGLDISESFTLPLRPFSFCREREERGAELRELAAKGPLYLCSGEENVRRQMAGFTEAQGITNYTAWDLSLEKSIEVSSIPAFILAEQDFLGVVKQTPQRRKRGKANPINSFVDLKEGDYVVHENHGIGQYVGMERLTIHDVARDYLHIRYRGQDKLYIPTDQMDLLQKYIGNSDVVPKVNKLGGKEWQTVKNKARAAVREMAADLLRLYAQRSQLQGFAFSEDSPWQWEMESDFPYEETADQSDAIADVKADMEKAKPMDRLLCGDVGYGKTEVALRAAFKAVLDGKQCAILVPTTVLAQQHEGTFTQRLAKFGVTVKALSRFKSAKEIKETLKGLAEGTVDIVIGTHMLLGKGVQYQDLGLLIIDEEQRFGVGHKEKIKALKKNIDVLAMSATPIPRTLHMSLLGTRDISVIETPPPRRQPVRTYVMAYQERVITEAIRRELARRGQVYYVHNRVEDIESVAAHLRALVPEASILVAHGQMPEKELEKVMMNFMQGEADLLLCTTIVESGLDFPNVNTLIVDAGDRLGLAQMYQLRGRVGRSRKQGYAYFFYSPGRLLALSARKRLAAIRDYTDLGSGFKIALRDMEIRGAGNILGPEQHGHLAMLGFELYCRLVNEEVKRLQGEEIKEEKQGITIDIACSAYLPDDYVGDGDVKIEVYKKIADLKTDGQLKDLLKELEDRFGSIPDSVYHLFLVARLKILAEQLDIVAIAQQKQSFKVTFKALNSIDGEAIAQLMSQFGRHFAFKMTETLEMTVKCGTLSEMKALRFLIKIFIFLVGKDHSLSSLPS